MPKPTNLIYGHGYNDGYPAKLIGYIIQEKVRCGKKNCRCYTKNEKHKAFYLYYREKQLDGTRKLKKKYLKKSEVKKWQKKLSSTKAYEFMASYPFTLEEMDNFLKTYSHLKDKEMAIKSYELFASPKIRKWANYDTKNG